MSASASGPIGALLLIAPLAAIPVLAIVGLPQFAPVAASPADEDDLDAVSLGSHTEDASANPSSPPHRADDLFAPIGQTTSAESSQTGKFLAHQTPRASNSRTSDPSYSDRLGGTRNENVGWTAPAGALDGWELGTTGSLTAFPNSDENPGPSRPAGNHFASVENSPDADALKAGFDPDLLRGDAPRVGQAPQEKRLPKTDRPERAPQMRETSPSEAPLSGEGNGMAEFYSKRGWLAAAARLRELGIRNYHLEWVVEDQRFVFWCTVPSGSDGRVSSRFEAQDEEPLYAVQKTLAEVESSLARVRR